MMIFHIQWDNILNIKLLDIFQVLLTIKGRLKMQELFSNYTDLEMGLRGMIVFLRSHYAYFGLGDDHKWYRVDDNVCQSIGIGRWYDVLLTMIYMKGVPIGLIYEDYQFADLSLYNIEVLFLEKVVYHCSRNGIDEAGILENCFDYSINPVKHLCSDLEQEIECLNCTMLKTAKKICDFCGFDPSENEWTCKECNFENSGTVLMCDLCDQVRFTINQPIFTCEICKKEVYFRFCTTCDVLKCCKCEKNITVVQTLICNKCKERTKEGFCNSCQNSDMLCKTCSKDHGF